MSVPYVPIDGYTPWPNPVWNVRTDCPGYSAGAMQLWITCPPDVLVNVTTGSGSAVVSWIPPTATGGSGSVTTTSNFKPGDTFPIGATEVTYEAKTSTETARCRFAVSVATDPQP